MKKYMKLDDVETIHFKLNPAQIARLADIYANGDGVERDERKANNYHMYSAMLGDPYAQTILANNYLIGRFIEKNENRAVYWFKKAAEQGNPYAQYEVGIRVSEAEGALLWLHSSAKQGFPMAMKELSDRLREDDPKKSKRWLKRYYRNKDKSNPRIWQGKAYLREIRGMNMPKVIQGEVMIRI